MIKLNNIINTSLRVVVAEDDQISRVMLHAVLRKWGYDVVSAKDGMECLEMLCSSPVPTIGLLDWFMPDFEGGAICQSLGKISTEQPVHLILMTSIEDGAECLRALEMGADDFMPKPYTINDLNAHMVKAERHLRMQTRLRSLENGQNQPSAVE